MKEVKGVQGRNFGKCISNVSYRIDLITSFVISRRKIKRRESLIVDIL